MITRSTNNESNDPPQFSCEISIENTSTGHKIIVSEPTWIFESDDDLNSQGVTFKFLPTHSNMYQQDMYFVIHDEFYRPRMIQAFPANHSTRGSFFQVRQLSNLLTTDALHFSVLHASNGMLTPLFRIKRHGAMKNHSKWTLHVRYHVDIYNRSRDVVQASITLALPRKDYPAHSQRSFMAVHSPSLITDVNENQFLHYENVIMKPGHSMRLHHDWYCTVHPKSINYLTASSLDEWKREGLKNGQQWLQEEVGIEKNHPRIRELCKDLLLNGDERGAVRRFWDVVRRIFLVLHSLIHIEIIPEEKGCAWALEHGKGDCTEFAATLVAIMRCLNIPARLVSGLKFNDRGKRWTRHAWAEVLSPRNEWILVDPLDQTIGYHPFYLPIYVGNWIPARQEPELVITTRSPQHENEHTIKKFLSVSTWIEGGVQRTARATGQNSPKVVFLDEKRQ